MQCIRDNLVHCHLQGDVRQADATTFLVKAPEQPYDIVFADPPYVKSNGDLDNDPLLTELIPFSCRMVFLFGNIMPVRDCILPGLGE